MEQTIHKRMMDTTLCGNRTWTLCEPNKVFEGPAKTYKNPEFIEWVKTNKHRWNEVNCPECLKRRFK